MARHVTWKTVGGSYEVSFAQLILEKSNLAGKQFRSKFVKKMAEKLTKI